MGELTLKNVSYTYSKGTPFEKKALSDVSLTFENGKITGLIGHTGSGKSTLVQMLNGLLKPESGCVALDGRDIWEEPKKIKEIRYKIGLVFQYPEYQLFEETVYKDIAYGPKNMGLDKAETDKRVMNSLKFCGLEANILEKSPFELSGGQKRRVAIAGVMAMEPEVLVLDEPAAGLDPLGREEILGGIWSYQRATGRTVIIVSHSMEDMAQYTDNIAVLNKSRVYMQGKTSEIFRHAEELKGVGLNVPQITNLMLLLKKRGFDVPNGIFTVDAATEEIIRLLKNK